MTLLQHPREVWAPRVLDLASHGEKVAVQTASGRVTYADLARRVDDAAALLGATRRLVLVEGSNTLDSLVSYLAALTHGHVVLLAPPGHPSSQLVEAWDPDVVVGEGGLVERHDRPRHDLHPDLALLLSTSGSTGSPKLVRLSHDNLRSNATSIATYLGLTPQDRAVTSLPMHYCYGLSVVHSHLLTGAGLVLTDLSVVDECFWRLAREAGATSFAGVPYTFEQLEHAGLDEERLPTLRYVTQAGGRLPPDRVRAWAERGRRAGWELVVMYGQTEATARMAWLPPELATERPESIGRPVPGGSFRIDPVPEATDPGVGELVYTGPNVMMGYAVAPADLARGPELSELRTGDLAREVDGLVEVVGRRGRHAKLFGLRLDLDHLERLVGDDLEVRCVVVDEAFHAFHTRRRGSDRVRAALAEASGLPASAIRVTTLDALPRTASGKPDLTALAEQARLVDADAEPDDDEVSPEAVRRDYALVLGRPDATTSDSFTGLGGDSLSYVELATRLGRRLGDAPPDWHLRTVDELVTSSRPRPGVRLDTSVVLRVTAILAIVGTHANLFTVVGGAHLLLAVAGHNFARFQLAAPTRERRLRHGLASLAQLVLPASLWIGAVGLVAGTYGPATTFFLNGLLGSDEWTKQWQFWFLESLVWVTVGALALVAVPALDRLERRSPYAVAIGLVLSALAVRFAWVGLHAGATERYTVGVVAWWFLLGWAATRADSPARRWLVVALAAVGTFGFFGDPVREALIVGGIALLVLAPTVRVPRRLVGPVSVVASSSLFVYLTHWQVYPHLEDVFPLGATVSSFAVGTTVWWACRPALRRVGRLLNP
ncbi:AMP-binding protein [Nocardioides euryhalodurans]|uniref:AMP-dependent synthetase n=1 Tax=Nocardioides euryhalodurans TaxID=2518370 RepID=A0A4P7GJF9_9ACTN|nr:AMP-binding protein [Nocardioides euryhalodurans]QBR92023.1 AMP-dependent synthetase [Nocardioides euryhalodurans]